MGQITPNIGIYIPAAGETNYDAPFAAGQINIDQHDHSGGPNKGVPLTSASFAAGSVTFDKLNANVVDITTGIGTSIGTPNQLVLLGILKALYQLSLVPTPGIVVENGSVATAVTITGTPNQIAVTNGNGTAGNPTLALSPIVTSATQPAFLATAVNQPGSQPGGTTGGGAAYLIKFTTISPAPNFQQGGTNFDGVSTFTVPAGATGVYLVGVDISVSHILPAHTTGFIDIYINGAQTFRGFNGNFANMANAGGGAEFPFSQIMKLNAGDTVTCVITVQGGTNTDIQIDNASDFSAVKMW